MRLKQLLKHCHCSEKTCFPEGELIRSFLCVNPSVWAPLSRRFMSFVWMSSEPPLTTLKSRLGGLQKSPSKARLSALGVLVSEVAARTSLTRPHSGVNVLSARSHASPTCTFSQQTRDQYVNRLRLSLRCLRPGEAISFGNKREFGWEAFAGDYPKTGPGVWRSCAPPDRRLFTAAG